MAFQAKLPLCVSPQMLSSLPGGLCELLRSLHVHSLKNDEVLLLRDSRRLAEFRDAGPQVGCRPFIMKESAQFTELIKAVGGGRRHGMVREKVK